MCATLDRETPPAQGGIQILGSVDVCTSLRPCTTSSSSLRGTVDGASLQFIDRVVDIAVMLRRQVRIWTGRQPCHGAEAASLAPVQQTTEIPWLQSIDQVFDVPVAQVQQFLGCRP